MNGAMKSERGMTLTELLVVLLIIALLATIAVPVYLSRIRLAQVNTAQMEAKELAMGEDACAAIHGFYVPLQMLDDLPVILETRDTFTDDLANEPDTALFIIKPNIPLSAQFNTPQQLSSWTPGATNFDLQAFQMRAEWAGPFVQFNRFFKGAYTSGGRIVLITSVTDTNYTTERVSRDFPLDPWGQPYRVFSPLGIMGTSAFTVSDPSDWDRDGKFDFFPARRTGNEDPYDRWTIVSYGPNQQPDQTTQVGNANDDVTYFFGTVVAESVFGP